MSVNAYYYFQSIYGNSNEPIICIDENLDIVFATPVSYSVFGIERNALNINCMLLRKHLSSVKTAFSKGECCSINCENVYDSSAMKCIFIPQTYCDTKYAVLIFTKIAAQEIDNLRKFELKRTIEVIKSSVVYSTSLIVSHMQLIKQDGCRDKSVNIVLQNVLILRKLYRNLSLMASSNLKSEFSQVIDINAYLKYITQIISTQIGHAKIEFEFSLCNELLVTEMEPKIFEILICNFVSSCLKNSIGKTKLTIHSALRGNENHVIFSNSAVNPKYLDKFMHSQQDILNSPENLFDLNISIIRKILADHSGKIFATENGKGGISVGFTLPSVDKRISDLHSPKQHESGSDEFFSNISIEMSEFIDVDNINL